MKQFSRNKQDWRKKMNKEKEMESQRMLLRRN